MRKPGTVKKAIGVIRHKTRRSEEAVSVAVRPAPPGSAGARSPSDPFYWRFLERGTRKMSARPFLVPAAKSKFGAALEVFERELSKRLVAMFDRLSK